ncbi:undecaprenyl-diphosphate phosphatase [Kutzneria sp. CA-103260]|uniref:undecaprenyl-diphosphate phosphatase n=1 Tax=Kutzneria sp. CA-103260 TaxID=2802641 RepID=UPI001BA5A187|nr:undecaprenyl-diphosphate phosphatase [Kutzneria sp. CA-103260]QUQ63809.1 undecaprenyl-diphosphatase [Kutzneria sp. CA-103260]
MSAPTYPEMIVVGLLQGVSELFPVSSLGHSVLLPALLGGQWAADLDMSTKGSAYLDTLVAMHVATAAALVIFFWRDWVRIVGGLLTSIRDRRIATPDQRLAWLLVAATVPVGIAGIALDSVMRQYLGKPVPAAAFLLLNGVVLLVVERLYRRQHADPEATTVMAAVSTEVASDARLSRLGVWEAVGIGACQILALLPGISRSGATMAGGLLRGLRHEDAARFAFLLATPAIAGAGLLKLPELARPEMHSAIGPTIVGSLVAGVGAYLSVRFLVRYFETRTLTPFAVYCVLAGLGCLGYFTLVQS